jgi:hypothetical protein
MSKDRIADGFAHLRNEAEEATSRLPEPDLDQAFRSSERRPLPFRLASRLPQFAAAAATLLVALGIVFLVPRPGTTAEEVPEYLALLVDSLYDDDSYILTDIAPRWETGDNDYLDAVWGAVADEIGGGASD